MKLIENIYRLFTPRIYAIVLSGVSAAVAVALTIRTGKLLDDGWIHPLVMGGVLAASFCIGLCLRQEWGRWVGFILIVAGGALVMRHTYVHGISTTRIAALLGLPFCIWYLWKLPITRVQELLNDDAFMSQVLENVAEISGQRESQDRWKIVILLRRPLELDAKALSQRAERAFDRIFDIIDREIDPVDACFLPSEQSHPHSMVAGRGPVLMCYNPPHFFGVFVLPIAFPAFCANTDRSVEVFNQILPEHHAFVEVEILPHFGNSGPVENGFAHSGKLAAALLTEDCAGIYLPERRRCFPMSSDLADALRSSDPLRTLSG